MFKALMLEKDDAGFRAALKSVDERALPEDDVVVSVDEAMMVRPKWHL
jgi:acrylyl-CoA reductase (NADPH)